MGFVRELGGRWGGRGGCDGELKGWKSREREGVVTCRKREDGDLVIVLEDVVWWEIKYS